LLVGLKVYDRFADLSADRVPLVLTLISLPRHLPV
jgi:hypothetical protein